jgi:electron transfer flavoprotein alpha subunit
MDWAVLVKGVPPLEQLRFDPDRRTMIREGTELILNPFDRRAVQLGLNLRRTGEGLTVVTMGPPSVENLLQESLALPAGRLACLMNRPLAEVETDLRDAWPSIWSSDETLGADRAVLVTDRLLAGSDTLVTARVLARALERVGHDVTLLGRWSIDSETGQVGPEVAGLLGVPIATNAREVVREAGDSLLVTSTIKGGWSRARWSAPIVVTVGEEVVRVRRPTPAEVEAVKGRAVERWNSTELHLSPSTLGLEGSPTVVTQLRDVQPVRIPTVFEDGDPHGRALRGAGLLLERLQRSVTGELPRPPPLERPLVDDREVFGLVTGVHGELDAQALPLLSEVRRNLPGFWPSAAWVGPRPEPADLRRLAAAGAGRVYVAEVSHVPQRSQTTAIALRQLLVRRTRSAGGMFLADEFGREVAGQVAASSDLGLVGDAVGLRVGPGASLVWEKPSFGGGIIADIESRTRPALATVRPGSFELLQPPAASDEELEVEAIPGPFPAMFVEQLEERREVMLEYGDLYHARVVVTVGMGVGGPEGISELLPHVRTLHGALGATRRVADVGWLPRQLQVGLTGHSIAPDLAILVGVNGATNHLVGLRRARLIAALNSDPAAPVFKSVDVGVVGSWRETLPPLVDALAESGWTVPK